MKMKKPFSPSCERNRDPLLTVLRQHFADRTRVLEIGSGTGQHAVHFAEGLPQLSWQASDCAEHLPGIRAWLDDAALPNTPAPLEFDVNQSDWPASRYDAVFTANTLHIMSWPEVERLFRQLPQLLTAQARVVIYGPFKYAGRFTSASNADFDDWLRARDHHSGIRDFEAVDALAQQIGLVLQQDHALPANNQCLVWQRQAA